MGFWSLVLVVVLLVLIILGRFGGQILSAMLAIGALACLALMGYAASLPGGEVSGFAAWQKLVIGALGVPAFAFMLIRCYRGFESVAPAEAFGTRLRLWFEGRA